MKNLTCFDNIWYILSSFVLLLNSSSRKHLPGGSPRSERKKTSRKLDPTGRGYGQNMQDNTTVFHLPGIDIKVLDLLTFLSPLTMSAGLFSSKRVRPCGRLAVRNRYFSFSFRPIATKK